MNREKIEKLYKWDLSSYYENEDDLNNDFEIIEKKLIEFEAFKGTLSKGEDQFLKVLNSYEKLSRLTSKVYVYCHLKKDEDSRVSENQSLASKAQMISNKVQASASFLTPEIMSLETSILDSYLKNDKIKKFKNFLNDILRKRPHVLSKEEEKILALSKDLSEVSENTFEMFSYADLQFPEITNSRNEKEKLTHGNFTVFLRDSNRSVRKEAFSTLYKTYETYKNTFASMLDGAIKREIFYAKVRKHPNALSASLFEDNIDISVYNNLIKTVHNYLKPMYNYMNLKREMLNIDKLHMYDIYVPLTDNYKCSISYQRAQEIILNALKPLGDDYLELIKKAFDERWIDVYENDGKKGGAYSWGSYDSHPYILMNYKNDLNSLFTLIHELGHSMHSYLSRSSQEYIDSQYTIFVAEVASTLNETLLIEYLLDNSSSKEEKLYLLNYFLEQFRTTVYRQTMFAEFEKIVHEKLENGESLNSKEFSKIYFELNKLYYGDDIIMDEEIQLEWARIPHFYSNFYVYKYATGFSAAIALADGILNKKEGAVERYKEFLKSGGSEYPIDQLKKAGVDMSDPASLSKALDKFNVLVETLQSLNSK